MRITVLVDHETDLPGVLTEWGASVFIECEGGPILFDTGTSGQFADNARTLGRSIADVRHAVLSHGHIDHGGGLDRFCAENAAAPIWSCVGANAEAFLRLGPLKKPVGLDAGALQRHADRLRTVETDTEIVPGVYLLTRLAGPHPTPSGNRLLWRRAGGGIVRDDFSHELMVAIEDADGLVLFSGCSHSGILNMVDAARERFAGRTIKALVGGFHFVGLPVLNLFGDGDEAVRAVAEGLRAAGIPRVLTTHCTGRAGYERLREVMGPAVTYVGAGASIDL